MKRNTAGKKQRTAHSPVNLNHVPIITCGLKRVCSESWNFIHQFIWFCTMENASEACETLTTWRVKNKLVGGVCNPHLIIWVRERDGKGRLDRLTILINKL